MLNLIWRDLGKFVLDFLSLHLIYCDMLCDVGWHNNLFVSSFARICLFCEPILQYLQYFALLFLLPIVQTSLNRQLFFLLLLSVLTPKLLGTFLSTTRMDAATAPKKD